MQYIVIEIVVVSEALQCNKNHPSQDFEIEVCCVLASIEQYSYQ